MGQGRISDLCRFVGRVVEQDGDENWQHVQYRPSWGREFEWKVIIMRCDWESEGFGPM